jgi:hypothetical protein
MSNINKNHNRILDKIRMNKKKVFYVCSYGGCGSKMLCEYLAHFGTIKHVHSRNPPNKLTQIGLYSSTDEWFSNKLIPDKDIPNYYVIYIYRDPIKAIQSRFNLPQHLLHIQSNPSITLDQVIDSKRDLYGIEHFFDNYTTRNVKRNYKIYCIKYENLFANIEQLNRVLNIRNNRSIYPVEVTREKPQLKDKETLENIYSNLKRKMERMPFIMIV